MKKSRGETKKSLRIVDGMLVILVRNLGQMSLGGPVLLHMLPGGIAEHLSCHRRWLNAVFGIHHDFDMLVKGVGAIVVLELSRVLFCWHTCSSWKFLTFSDLASERTTLHFFETESQDALGKAAGHELVRHEQGGGPGGAVVVDVVNRDACQTNLIQSSLSTSRIPYNNEFM